MAYELYENFHHTKFPTIRYHKYKSQYLFGIFPSLLIFPGNVPIFPLGCIDWQLHYRNIKHSSKAICRGRELESERCLVVIYSSVVRTLAAQVTNPGFNSLVTTTSFTFLLRQSFQLFCDRTCEWYTSFNCTCMLLPQFIFNLGQLFLGLLKFCMCSKITCI